MTPNTTASEFWLAITLIAMSTVLLATAGCSDDYRSDPALLSVNSQLTARLQRDPERKPFPAEVQGLNCAIAYSPAIGSMLNSYTVLACDAILRPEIARKLKDPVTWSERIDDYYWIRSDGTSSLVDSTELRDSRFQFVIDTDPSGQPRVRASIDQSRVPYGEAASLVLMAAERAAPVIDTTLRDQFAWTPDGVAKSWQPPGSPASPVAGQPTTAAGSSADTGQPGGAK